MEEVHQEPVSSVEEPQGVYTKEDVERLIAKRMEQKDKRVRANEDENARLKAENEALKSSAANVTSTDIVQDAADMKGMSQEQLIQSAIDEKFKAIDSNSRQEKEAQRQLELENGCVKMLERGISSDDSFKKLVTEKAHKVPDAFTLSLFEHMGDKALPIIAKAMSDDRFNEELLNHSDVGSLVAFAYRADSEMSKSGTPSAFSSPPDLTNSGASVDSDDDNIKSMVANLNI